MDRRSSDLFMFMMSTAAKIKVARMLYLLLALIRRPFGGRDLVRVRRAGVVWDLDLREGIDLTIYALGVFERETHRTLTSLVEPGATVLDIGANIGAHTLHLARLVGEKGRVIAFEPTDFAVAKLRANLRANPELEGRVDVRQAFLVAEAGDASIPAVPSSWPVDGTRQDDVQMGSRSMETSGAVATTVDLVMAALSNPDVRLIKMDVDGHELEVLQGARHLLRNRRPVIVMELAPYVFRPAPRFDAMVKVLTELDYSFRRLGSPEMLASDPELLRAIIPAMGSINVVAHPRTDAPKERVAAAIPEGSVQ